MKPPPLLLLGILPALAALALSGCVTHITTDTTMNPPPAEKFSDFSRFELAPLRMDPPYAGQSGNEKARKKIQEDISVVMDPVIARWNAAGRDRTVVRTLRIEPSIVQIKFLNATVRVWTGWLSGSSAVLLKARITDRESGRVIAEPVFYARGAAVAGAYSFGITDNAMLARIANRLNDYLKANYSAAVGGPTGAGR